MSITIVCNFHISHSVWPLVDYAFCIMFQLLREAGTSVLEILKVNVVSFVYIPMQVIPIFSITEV